MYTHCLGIISWMSPAIQRVDVYLRIIIISGKYKLYDTRPLYLGICCVKVLAKQDECPAPDLWVYNILLYPACSACQKFL